MFKGEKDFPLTEISFPTGENTVGIGKSVELLFP